MKKRIICLLWILAFSTLGCGLGKSEKQPEPAPEAESRILYQKEGITVTEQEAAYATAFAPQGEICLTVRSEEELLNQPLVLRARLKDVQYVEIRQEGVPLPHAVSLDQAVLLSLDPLSVLKGELPAGKPVKVYADRYWNYLLTDANPATSGEGNGWEGIFMLLPLGEEYPDYAGELADYAPGDSFRFAIWERPAGGLVYAESYFPGLNEAWGLDQAEDYIRGVIK